MPRLVISNRTFNPRSLTLMNTHHFNFRKTLLLTLTMGVIVGGFPIEAFAQRYIPRDRGLPGRREGGGTRGDCIRAGNPSATRPSALTALMPDKNLGLTTSNTPTLFWYVPENAATAAEFILMDDSDTEVYKARFQVTGEAGIISLSLPEEAGLPPLEVGKDYHWSFALICAAQESSDNSGIVFTEGWIQRIEADAELQARLDNTAEQDRALVYAEAGIWQDALSSLASQRRTQPTNSTFATRWNTLLESVGLTSLSTQPLMQRYQLAAAQTTSTETPDASASEPMERQTERSQNTP
jgi:hypothetical protein